MRLFLRNPFKWIRGVIYARNWIREHMPVEIGKYGHRDITFNSPARIDRALTRTEQE